MGRHRNDPRGVGQVMAIVGAVVLLVSLLALGGYFLSQALPSNNDASVSASDTSTEPEDPEGMGALYIEVVGESSNVFVRESGGDVLMDSELSQGQTVNYNDAENGLEVTIGEPGAVDVYVDGDPHEIPDEDADYSFTVND